MPPTNTAKSEYNWHPYYKLEKQNLLWLMFYTLSVEHQQIIFDRAVG